MRWHQIIAEGEQPSEKFMDELYNLSQDHPFSHRKRVIGEAVVEVYTDGANGIRLSDITSNTPGHGTKAMQLLCDLADKHKVTITLYAKGYADTPSSKLVEWYKRFGFVVDEEYFPDNDDEAEMIRHPK